MRFIIDWFLYRLGFVTWRASSYSSVLENLSFLVPKPARSELIRLGGEGDGGYLIPDDLSGIVALFSPGVGSKWSFEEAVSNRSQMRVFLCDPVPPNSECPFEVDLIRLGPATTDSCISLADWVESKCPNSGDLMLQMDIEGAEYLTLLACPAAVLRRFRIIVLELHGLKKIHDDTWSKMVLTPFFESLATNFTSIHVHPNNVGGVDRRSGVDIPNTLEVTLLRSDHFGLEEQIVVQYPNVLDAPNDLNHPDIRLSSFWRQG